MKKTMSAMLHWRSAHEGGRASLPLGRSYSTVSRFDHQSDEDWLKNAWSLMIDFVDPPRFGAASRVSVSFLVEDAPHDWLEPGRHFDLFEGKNLVAQGRID